MRNKCIPYFQNELIYRTGIPSTFFHANAPFNRVRIVPYLRIILPRSLPVRKYKFLCEIYLNIYGTPADLNKRNCSIKVLQYSFVDPDPEGSKAFCRIRIQIRNEVMDPDPKLGLNLIKNHQTKFAI
jgi:hypothetical protein